MHLSEKTRSDRFGPRYEIGTSGTRHYNDATTCQSLERANGRLAFGDDGEAQTVRTGIRRISGGMARGEEAGILLGIPAVYRVDGTQVLACLKIEPVGIRSNRQ
jgi:hypothetical protein